MYIVFFFLNDTATTEIYTLPLHDALPISRRSSPGSPARAPPSPAIHSSGTSEPLPRSEEHTSELQSQSNLVCRLLLEKKKQDAADFNLTDITECEEYISTTLCYHYYVLSL